MPASTVLERLFLTALSDRPVVSEIRFWVIDGSDAIQSRTTLGQEGLSAPLERIARVNQEDGGPAGLMSSPRATTLENPMVSA